MTHFPTLRRLAGCTLVGLLIAALPIRLVVDTDNQPGLAPAMVLAESGKGSDGDGREDDDRDRDSDDGDNDDNSGREGGGDDDRDDDRGDDDNRGSGNSGDRDDDDDGERLRSGRNGDRDSGGTRQPVTTRAEEAGQDLHLRYSNGWEEWVRDGRYGLKDPFGRTVSNRRATQADLARMRQIAGQ